MLLPINAYFPHTMLYWANNEGFLKHFAWKCAERSTYEKHIREHIFRKRVLIRKESAAALLEIESCLNFRI